MCMRETACLLYSVSWDCTPSWLSCFCTWFATKSLTVRDRPQVENLPLPAQRLKAMPTVGAPILLCTDDKNPSPWTVISTVAEESRESGILSRSGEIPRMFRQRCQPREFDPKTVPHIRSSLALCQSVVKRRAT